VAARSKNIEGRMPCPRNLTTETVIAVAAGEVVGRRLQRSLALVVFCDW
jgi:hypothetical protein